MTSDQLIGSYETLLRNASILRAQYSSYAAGQNFTIADARVKAIPIVEQGEQVIDLREWESERIRMLPDPRFPFEGPACNSGWPSASKMRAGLYHKLQNMVEALDRFAGAFGYAPGQIGIRVFEGLRDLNTQSFLFQKKLDEILAIQPHLTIEEAEQETCKWISPVKNNVPVHSTGAAIDLRLWDSRKNDFVDMGPFGVIWGPNDAAPTFSENISDEQKKNRLYSLIVAEHAGLINYVYEFWHFSSMDRYAAYWENKDCASYGAVH